MNDFVIDYIVNSLSRPNGCAWIRKAVNSSWMEFTKTTTKNLWDLTDVVALIRSTSEIKAYHLLKKDTQIHTDNIS